MLFGVWLVNLYSVSVMCITLPLALAPEATSSRVSNITFISRRIQHKVNIICIQVATFSSRLSKYFFERGINVTM